MDLVALLREIKSRRIEVGDEPAIRIGTQRVPLAPFLQARSPIDQDFILLTQRDVADARPDEDERALLEELLSARRPPWRAFAHDLSWRRPGLDRVGQVIARLRELEASDSRVVCIDLPAESGSGLTVQLQQIAFAAANLGFPTLIHRPLGRHWVHAALEGPSRFLLDIRLGPRTLEMAVTLLASVALACGGVLPLLLVDNHLPYPQAILQVFGQVRHGRRRHGRGRRKQPRLAAPPGLLAGVVQKVRDARGNLLRVRTRALFGRLKDVRRRVRRLKLGRRINTACVERFNGTVRTKQPARLGRRTRAGSSRDDLLAGSLALFRDLYNWVWPHSSLSGRTPAMALGLAQEAWTVRRYVTCPVHVSDLQRQVWAEELKKHATSALDQRNARKPVPTS